MEIMDGKGAMEEMDKVKEEEEEELRDLQQRAKLLEG